ncbi:MAG: hypothetical protein RMJ43_07965 [Chloroherpetonaceae bacterium]|nr:hypothetical protein [Chthonomonadaceae bacterium]MDW8207757.1 hypothetical protein [Chloroherpetonaceae bacterium]
MRPCAADRCAGDAGLNPGDPVGQTSGGRCASDPIRRADQEEEE